MKLDLYVKKWTQLSTVLLLVFMVGIVAQKTAYAATPNSGTGILVITPDRGFLGNVEIRDGFDLFSEGRNADILYVAGDRSEEIFNEKIKDLTKKGAKHIIALPLFISAADANWKKAESWLKKYQQEKKNLSIAKLYGTSYLAVEDLADRLRETPTEKEKVLLLGYGATDAQSAQQMKAELKRLGAFASTLEEKDIDVAISPAWGGDTKSLRSEYRESLKNAHDTLVVPVLLANRADGMMSFTSGLSRSIPHDAELVTSEFATAEGLGQWMTYATNQVLLQLPGIKQKDVGAIALAHGSGWFWNQAIRDALKPVEKHYPTVYTFSMADQPLVERAVREMEQQPVNGAVLVRIFGQSVSFESSILHMLGADIESGAEPSHGGGHGGHGDMMGMSHGHMDMSHGEHSGHGATTTLAASPRIRSSVPIVTVGGVEDNVYFAKALLENARSVSKDPSKETIILTAHGAGPDDDNEHWYGLLDNLAEQMKQEKGYNFKEIRAVTWREDWPAKSKPEIEKARKWVEEINASGGSVIIVPARTNGRGAANRYLEGLDFAWSQGFAQTPFFSQWFDQQVSLGADQLAKGN